MFLPFDESASFTFYAIGISHWKTPLSVREQLSISKNKALTIFEKAKSKGLHNLLIINTCNRTELYGFTDNVNALQALFFDINTEVDQQTIASYLYQKKNHEAVLHLFKVVAGIDSQILGDFEIVGQVKQALQLSIQQDCASSQLIRLVEQSIKCSKKIKTETDINAGYSSIASAATYYLQKNNAHLAQQKILLMGVGKIGRTTCHNLTKIVATENITIINRTSERAKNLANLYHIKSENFAHLAELIHTHDIIIVATNAEKPIVLPHHFSAIQHPKIIFDLSVPRNVEPSVGLMANITLLNIEQLEDIKNETLINRQKSVPVANQIIHQHILEYYNWLHSTAAFSLLALLQKPYSETQLHQAVQQLMASGIFNQTLTTENVLSKSIEYVKKYYHLAETQKIFMQAFG